MKKKICEVREYIKAICKTPTRTNEGQFIVNSNAAMQIERCILDFANIIKPYDNNVSESLFSVSEKLFIAVAVHNIKTGDYIVSNYYLGMLDTVVDFIDSDFFQNKLQTKRPKIFISHSTEDADYVKAFVNMLEKIGVRNEEQLFCSSIHGYDIKLKENIYSRLLSEFESYNLYVILILSKNYYKSKPCLNEMGAAWALRTDCQAILLPSFKYTDVQGAIDPREISIKLDDVKGRSYKLIELKNIIINKLELENLDEKKWERYKTDFLETIDYLTLNDNQKKKQSKY